MCDTLVAARGEHVWFAKNSDREPGEAQWLELHDVHSSRRGRPAGLPQADADARVLVSRPCWMWGAEIGANRHGVAIGNEAVFTRMPVAAQGLSGMDMLRSALERSHSADDALEAIVELLDRYAQGGRMAHRQRSFRYHSSFAIADGVGAWLLETAGPYWATRRVRGAATLSNGLTITTDYDRVHPQAQAYARGRGWLGRKEPLDFARAFSDRATTLLAGATTRRRTTAGAVAHAPVVLADLLGVLRRHHHADPNRGARSLAPCAHAHWLPTRWAAQTTASMVVRCGAEPEIWATGTSSPCLSIFKPAPLDAELFPPRPIADATPKTHGPEAAELWWRHERLHRACMRDYAACAAAFASERAALEQQALADSAPRDSWQQHADAIDDWSQQVARITPRGGLRASSLFWHGISRLDGLSPL